MRFAKHLFAALLLACAPFAARAQSTPGFTTGQIPTALQWNNAFAAKQDFSATLGTYATLSGTGLVQLTSGVPSVGTLSSQLNANIGSTVGTLAVRGASGTWTALVPGANGTILQSTGTSSVPIWASGVGTGTMTSATLSMPSFFAVSTPTITTSGTYGVTFATQSANCVLAGPTSGGAATPTCRSLVPADIPLPTASTIGGTQSKAAISHLFLTALSTAGVFSAAQPACGDLSDSTAGCNTAVGTTGATLPLNNGNNVFSGHLAFAGVNVKVRTVTAAGAVTVATTDYLICLKKATPATTAINLPTSPATGDSYGIKDCAGNDASFAITVTPPGGTTIDGQTTYVMNTSATGKFDAIGVVFTGTEWSIF